MNFIGAFVIVLMAATASAEPLFGLNFFPFNIGHAVSNTGSKVLSPVAENTGTTVHNAASGLDKTTSQLGQDLENGDVVGTVGNGLSNTAHKIVRPAVHDVNRLATDAVDGAGQTVNDITASHLHPKSKVY